MSDSYTVQVLDGMAKMLATADAGVYRGPESVFTPSERGIVFSNLGAAPLQGIALTRYLDVPGIIGINQVMVQAHSRCSSNPLEGEALVDLIRDTFHRKTNVQLNELRFNLIEQKSFAPLGPDKNGQFEYTQNFLLTGNR